MQMRAVIRLGVLVGFSTLASWVSAAPDGRGGGYIPIPKVGERYELLPSDFAGGSRVFWQVGRDLAASRFATGQEREKRKRDRATGVRLAVSQVFGNDFSGQLYQGEYTFGTKLFRSGTSLSLGADVYEPNQKDRGTEFFGLSLNADLVDASQAIRPTLGFRYTSAGRSELTHAEAAAAIRLYPSPTETSLDSELDQIEDNGDLQLGLLGAYAWSISGPRVQAWPWAVSLRYAFAPKVMDKLAIKGGLSDRQQWHPLRASVEVGYVGPSELIRRPSLSLSATIPLSQRRIEDLWFLRLATAEGGAFLIGVGYQF